MNYYRKSIFLKIWFWFLVVLTVYLVIATYDFLELGYTRQEWWEKVYNILSALLGGAIISFLFYFLVVFIPEQRKRHIIKANLKKMYARIKRDILRQVILASQKGGRTDLLAEEDTVEQLLTIDGFKNAFTGGSEGHEGFYAFRNYIGDDVPEYREIVLNLEILSKQIDFVLHNYPIQDSNVFDFFKRLEAFLMRLKEIGSGYEEEEVLSSFIWEIFGGVSWVSGDRGYDIVEKTIEEI